MKTYEEQKNDNEIKVGEHATKKVRACKTGRYFDIDKILEKMMGLGDCCF